MSWYLLLVSLTVNRLTVVRWMIKEDSGRESFFPSQQSHDIGAGFYRFHEFYTYSNNSRNKYANT